MTALSDYWTNLVAAATARWPTPFYLTAWEPIDLALRDLKQIVIQRPLRHWLSVKTQPLKPLLRRWAEAGWGAEVVSEYELRAAVAEGFKPEKILVNGVAKHTWLSRCLLPGLNVHVDSLTEASHIGSWASEFNWRLGLRLHVDEEFDPDEPQFGGQFGMTGSEASEALDLLRGRGLTVSGLHFHLRSNVDSADSFRRALSEAAQFCDSTNWRPVYIDTGGGLPDPGVTSNFDVAYLSDLGSAVDEFISKVGSVQEVWMEHGRFLTGCSAVLVLRVLDMKDRRECRYLICDGGRTNHALISDWESHPLCLLPEREGPNVLTTVSGPTCMAFDRLARLDLPNDVAIGDLVIWTHAGAYHLPWETRFSRGLCRVVWCRADEDLRLVRDEESFDDWWGQWP